MGYHLSAKDADGTYLHGYRVGTNGSQDVLAAVLLAGYAAGRFPHSDRIRGSWVTPMPGLGAQMPDVALPPWHDTRTRRVFNAWLEFNHDGCTWLTLNCDAMTLGRKFKAITCPVLTALVGWIDVRDGEGDQMGRLEGPAVERLADALDQVEPFTRPSVWHDNVAELARIVRLAADARGTLVFG